MADQFVSHHLHEIRQLSGSHRTALFSVCVVNFVFSAVAIFGNILAIQALRKTSFLPANLRKIFLSLSFTDLAVGVLGQPSLAVLQGMALNGNCNLDVLCPLTLTFCYAIIHLIAIASFLNVTAIAVDRLLAVSLHLRYDELVTSRRVTTALVAIWLTSCLNFRYIYHGEFTFFCRHRIDRISVNNSCILSCLQSSPISLESNSKSISATTFASSGAPQRTKVRLKCLVHLFCICRVLSSIFLLHVITNNGFLACFYVKSKRSHIFYRSSQFVVKFFGLLLAVSRGSSYYEEHFEENCPCLRRVIISYDARINFTIKNLMAT